MTANFSLEMITAAAQSASYEAPAPKAHTRADTPAEPIFTIGTYEGGSGRGRFNSAMREALEGHNFGKYLKFGVASLDQGNLIVFLKFSKEAPASKAEEKITSTLTNEFTTPFFSIVERTSQIINAERRSSRANPSHIPALEAMQQLYGDYSFGGPVGGNPEPGKLYTLPAGNDNDAFVIIPRRPLTDENIVKWKLADNEVLEARRRSSKAQSILRVVWAKPDAERDALVADKCGDDAELLELTNTLLAGRREREQHKATAHEMLTRITAQELPEGHDNGWYFDQLVAECSGNQKLLKIVKAAWGKNPVNVDVTATTDEAAELEEVDTERKPRNKQARKSRRPTSVRKRPSNHAGAR